MTSNRLEGLRFENGVLRHADGSIDIAAYGRRARGQRLAALHGAFRDLYTAVRGVATTPAREPARKPTLSSKPC